jgi:dTDP-4-amino-4,6-dideoxygalactose transaminase
VIPLHTNSRQHMALADAIAAALTSYDLADDRAFGQALDAFEQDLDEYCWARFAVAVASGTDALTIALAALDLPPGAEVITSDFGFYATPAAILRAGLTPVLVDTYADGFLIDPRAVEAAITDRTACIVPVHLFGQSTDMRSLSQIAVDHGLALVEDCAQALGARHGDHMAGTFGEAAILSFNWSKHLSCTSNGGAVITNDEHLVDRLKALRAYGSLGRFWHPWQGLNSKLNPFEAVILRAKLPHLDTWIERRREIAERYRSGLSDTDVLLPAPRAAAEHIYHKFTVRLPERDRLRKHLDAKSIGSMVCYPHLLHEQPAFEGRVKAEGAPNASRWTDTVLSIPIWPELDDSEVDYIIAAIRDFCGST